MLRIGGWRSMHHRIFVLVKNLFIDLLQKWMMLLDDLFQIVLMRCRLLHRLSGKRWNSWRKLRNLDFWNLMHAMGIVMGDGMRRLYGVQVELIYLVSWAAQGGRWSEGKCRIRDLFDLLT